MAVFTCKLAAPWSLGFCFSRMWEFYHEHFWFLEHKAQSAIFQTSAFHWSLTNVLQTVEKESFRILQKLRKSNSRSCNGDLGQSEFCDKCTCFLQGCQWCTNNSQPFQPSRTAAINYKFIFIIWSKY
jgi:hypothetical protein